MFDQAPEAAATVDDQVTDQQSPLTTEADDYSPSPETFSENEEATIEGSDTQSLIDWTKDGRYEKMWGKDPNKLYESTKGLESKFQLTATELNQLKKWKTENEPVLSQVQELQEYQSKMTQYHDLLGAIGEAYQDPVMAGRMEEFFNEIQSNNDKRRYGNFPPEAIERMKTYEKEQSDLKKRISDFDAKEKEITDRQLMNEYSSQLNPVLEKLQTLSTDIGVGQEAFDEVLNHCVENKIHDPKAIEGIFYATYQDQIKDHYIKSAQTQMRKKVNQGTTQVGSRGPVIPSQPTDVGSGSWLKTMLSNAYDNTHKKSGRN